MIVSVTFCDECFFVVEGVSVLVWMLIRDEIWPFYM